jgi:hypothetical protein
LQYYTPLGYIRDSQWLLAVSSPSACSARHPSASLAREYARCMTENPQNLGEVVGDHQVITRAGQVEAVVVPLEEYRALKALEQREAELYWAVHEARYPSEPGDDAPEDSAYDSMDALLADLDKPR